MKQQTEMARAQLNATGAITELMQLRTAAADYLEQVVVLVDMLDETGREGDLGTKYLDVKKLAYRFVALSDFRLASTTVRLSGVLGRAVGAKKHELGGPSAEDIAQCVADWSDAVGNECSRLQRQAVPDKWDSDLKHDIVKALLQDNAEEYGR